MRESVIYQEILREGRREGRREGEQIGEQKGRREGEQIGEQKGEQKAKTEIALNLLRDGITVDLVVKFTGLSLELVQNLAGEITNS